MTPTEANQQPTPEPIPKYTPTPEMSIWNQATAENRRATFLGRGPVYMQLIDAVGKSAADKFINKRLQEVVAAIPAVTFLQAVSD